MKVKIHFNEKNEVIKVSSKNKVKPSKTYNAKDTECLSLKSRRINVVVKGCLSVCWVSLSMFWKVRKSFLSLP